MVHRGFDPSLARAWGPEDDGWPEAFGRVRPQCRGVRVLGRVPDLGGAVAIVGTRFADAEALEFAAELAGQVAAAGRVVVSGGAFGIDAAAHEGALSVGGSTLVVLPSGFRPVYPRRHRELFERVISAGGALLTEEPEGSQPARHTFLRRNRLIAALGSATLVVQAPVRSGALSTARAAAKLDRPVFSVPYAPWDVRGEGCLQLLRRGGRICTSASDVLSVRPPEARVPGTGGEQRRRIDSLGVGCSAVFGQLSRRPRHPDELGAQLGMSVPQVQAALLSLVLAGAARKLNDGTYVRHVDSKQR